MKNKLVPWTLCILVLVCIMSCEDFLDVDLSKKSITVLAPANNTVLSSFTPLFKWEELKGADLYQLQVVKPSFANISQFLLDTSTASSSFSYTLSPGNYQWRVRAKNGSSMTEYVTYNLTIDSSSGLASSSVVLTLPNDNLYTNNMMQTFTWQALPSATNYLFQISSVGSSVNLQSVTDLTTSFTFTAEGTYQWKVIAQNGFSNSMPSTRTITIDTTKPDVPAPIFPSMDTITADPVPLKWNATAGTDSTHLLISTDSTFASSTVDVIVANTTNPTIYNFSSAVPETYYYWKLQGKDKAGNKSVLYSPRRRFKRNS